MSQALYRRKAILSRIHKALDAFYLLQKIDWEYDIRVTLERILKLALEEIEFDGGKTIERALIILHDSEERALEIKAGYKVENLDLSFSRTVVQQTLRKGESILCENAVDDPRFMEAESIKELQTLSLICVPLKLHDQPIGAIYVESNSPGSLFETDELEFLREFAEMISPYLKTALTHQDHVQEIRRLKEKIGDRFQSGNIIGHCESMQNLFDLINIASTVDRTVLITGESGSGKELVSKAIHYSGHRKDGNFVVVDCSGLSEHLLESELFGHKQGSFTGAATDKTGAFEEADGGTLFLDEISDASMPLQRKLRRVLQEKEIRRVGDNEVRSVNVRVICATNKNLAELARQGEFIRDLYFRVNKFPIHLPPLRERREDIPLLVNRFLELYERPGTARPQGLTPDAMEFLVEHDWAENNVRELRNAVELAADFAAGNMIDRDLLVRTLNIQQADSNASRKKKLPTPAMDGSGRVHIHRESFRQLLDEYRVESEGEGKGKGKGKGKGEGEGEGDGGKKSKSNAPFYRMQLEFNARLIIEGLRANRWKLRPAARDLGISPMKLRGELKEFLKSTVAECSGDIDEAARELDIPPEILQKKISDLGLDDL